MLFTLQNIINALLKNLVIKWKIVTIVFFIINLSYAENEKEKDIIINSFEAVLKDQTKISQFIGNLNKIKNLKLIEDCESDLMMDFNFIKQARFTQTLKILNEYIENRKKLEVNLLAGVKKIEINSKLMNGQICSDEVFELEKDQSPQNPSNSVEHLVADLGKVVSLISKKPKDRNSKYLWGRDDTESDYTAGGRSNPKGLLTVPEAKEFNTLLNTPASKLNQKDKERFKELYEKNRN